MTYRGENTMLILLAIALTVIAAAKYRIGSQPWEWGLTLSVAAFMLVMSFVPGGRSE